MINIKKKYCQKNENWRYKKLGTCTKSTIGSDGCLISCLAMICEYYGYRENPKTINEKLKKNNGYARGCLYVWGAIQRIRKDIREMRVRTNYRLNDNNMNAIADSIKNGFPVMLWIDYNYNTARNDMHWVLAINTNQKDENDITIIDPIDGRTKSLKKYLGGVIPNARRTIEAMVFYTGKVPAGGLTNKAEVLTKKEKILKEIRIILNKIL